MIDTGNSIETSCGVYFSLHNFFITNEKLLIDFLRNNLMRELLHYAFFILNVFRYKNSIRWITGINIADICCAFLEG